MYLVKNRTHFIASYAGHGKIWGLSAVSARDVESPWYANYLNRDARYIRRCALIKSIDSATRRNRSLLTFAWATPNWENKVIKIDKVFATSGYDKIQLSRCDLPN